jgi:beta-glucosidase
MDLDEKVMQTQCLWIQKSTILNSNGDFDEAKAEKAVKNGLGELARLNENAGPNSYGYHPEASCRIIQ